MANYRIDNCSRGNQVEQEQKSEGSELFSGGYKIGGVGDYMDRSQELSGLGIGRR